MAVIPKDPLDWLTLFRQQINEIFTFLSTLEVNDSPGEHENTPFLDIFVSGDKYVVEVELPGFEHRDISLSICCNMLVIEGLKREENGESGSTISVWNVASDASAEQLRSPPPSIQQG